MGDVLPEDQARKLFAALCERIREARRYNAVARGVPLAAPGRSQWGHIKQLASDYRNDAAQLWHALTNEKDGVLRERSGWELRYGPEPEQQLDLWMRNTLRPHGTQDYFSRQIGHLAVLGLQQAWLDCCAGTESEDSAA